MSVQYKYYSAFIYKSLDDPRSFDIEVSINNRKILPNSKKDLLYAIYSCSARKVSMGKITAYMHWKFPHCQSKNGKIIPCRNNGIFTSVSNSLEWIVSIVETEFDFHVGRNHCSRPEYNSMMKEYTSSQYNGFGVVSVKKQ
jgi:hypothetical protein